MPGQEQKVVEFYRSNAEAQASLQAPIFEDKVVNFILEMATVNEHVVTPEQLRAETEAQAEAKKAEDEAAAAEKPKRAAASKMAPAKKKASAKAATEKSPSKPKATGARSEKAAGANTKSADNKDAS